MPVIPHKGIIERDDRAYAHVVGGFVAFAASLHCDTVVFNAACYSAEKTRRALDAGMKVFFYAGVGQWHRDNWRATRDRVKALCATDHRIAGYMPDIEDWLTDADPQPEWDSAPQSEIDAFADALNEDSQHLSVGFNSFPSWPRWRVMATRAPHVWASPQLYGIRTPGTPAQLLQRGEPWRRAFRGGYCPTLAAYHRNAVELRAYLQGMQSVPNALFWHESPLPSGDSFAAIRDFNPGGVRSPWGAIMSALGLGVASGLLTLAITHSK